MAVTNNFASSALDLNGKISLTLPTALVWGPDGRLYVTEVDGDVKVLSVAFGNNPDDDGAENQFYVTDATTIGSVKAIQTYNDDGTPNNANKRQVTGIDVTQQFDASGAPMTLADGTAMVTMYVTSSDSRIGAGTGGNDAGLDTNSGVITKLTQTGPDSWDAVDIVRGLARSEENHALNGLEAVQELDGDGNLVSERLIVANGGNANTGAPSNNFAGQQEQPYSAAILEVDLDAINDLPVLDDGGRAYVYDLPTLDDPTRAGTSDNNDPFGGNDGRNSAKLTADSPVQIYSPGYRNAYDVEVTDDGRVFTYDNGANNSWGGRPVGEQTNNGGPMTAEDFAAGYIATNLNNGDGNSNDTINVANFNPSNKDQFHEVTRGDDLDGRELSAGKGGAVTYTDADGVEHVYGGHPNPTRAEGSQAGLLFSPKGGVEDAFLLVSNVDSAGNGNGSDYDEVIAWLTTVEGQPNNADAGDLTSRVLSVTPGVNYDIYAVPGGGVAVPVGQSGPGNGTLLGQAGLPSDIGEIVAAPNQIEGDYLEAGKFDGAIDTGNGSINGLTEYTSTILDGDGVKMSGAIIAASKNQKQLYVIGRDEDGVVQTNDGGTFTIAADRAFISTSDQVLGLASVGDDYADGFGLSQAFQGSIWAPLFFGGTIEILQPGNPDNPLVPLAGQEIVDETDADLDGVDNLADPFEFSLDNGYALAAGQQIVIDFDPTSTAFPDSFSGTGLLGAALDGVTPNRDARTEAEFPDSPENQRDGLFDNAGNIIPGGNAPIFQIKKVVDGTMIGAGNTARDAMHTGIRPSDDVGRVVATTNVVNWIASRDEVFEGQVSGLVYSDGTQSNFLRLVIGAIDENGTVGVEVGYELADGGAAGQAYAVLASQALPALESTDVSNLDLRIEVSGIKTEAFDVTASYRLEGQAEFTALDLGGFQLPEGVLRDVLTGDHTITDGDGPALPSGAAIGFVAEDTQGDLPPDPETAQPADDGLLSVDFNDLKIEAFGNEIEAGDGDAVGAPGTDGVDTVRYTGTETELAPLAADVENFDGRASAADYALTANALDNDIAVGAGANVIATGAGADTVRGTLAQLDGDDITDFTQEDRVLIEGATLADLGDITYAAGSAVLTTGDGEEITFSGGDFEDFAPADGPGLFDVEQVAGGVEITLVPDETILYRVNAGSNAGPGGTQGTIAAIDGGPAWLGDATALAGSGVSLTGNTNNTFSDGTSNEQSEITFTAGVDAAVVPWQVFANERSDNNGATGGQVTYDFDVEAGATYRIDYFYSENWSGYDGGTQPDRVFDVEVEGQVPTVFDDLFPAQDAAAALAASGDTDVTKADIVGAALVRSHEVVAGDDTLSVALVKQAGFQNPKVNAIQITQLGGGGSNEPIDATAPAVVSIDVENELNDTDSPRDATLVLTDETGFEEAALDAALDGSELTFSGVVPGAVSDPVVTLSDGGKTATVVYALDAPASGWAQGQGTVSLAAGAFTDAAGNASPAAQATFQSGAVDRESAVAEGGAVFALDFEAGADPIADGGFETVLGGSGAIEAGKNPRIENGDLALTTSAGDLSQGPATASKNDFVRGADVSGDAITEVTLSARMDNPFDASFMASRGYGTEVPNYLQQGIVVATGAADNQAQDQFVKLIVGGASGTAIQIWSQGLIDSKVTVEAMSNAAVAEGKAAFDITDVATIELGLVIDKAADTIAPLVTLYDASGATLGGVRPAATDGFGTLAPTALPTAVNTAIDGGTSVFGVTSNDFNQGTQLDDSFEARWEDLTLTSPQVTDGPLPDAFDGAAVASDDFSDDRLDPTDVGTLEVGATTLRSTVQGDAGGRDRDYVQFTVAEGQQLDRIMITGFEAEGGNAGFVGLVDLSLNAIPEVPTNAAEFAAAAADLLGGSLLGGSGEGAGVSNDLLASLADGQVQGEATMEFDAPLGAGTYALWFNQNGSPSTATLSFEVSAIAGPIILSISGAPTAEESGDTGTTALAFDLSAPGFEGTASVAYEVDGEAASQEVVFDAAGAGTLTIEVANDDEDTGDTAVAVTITGATDQAADPQAFAVGTEASASGTVTEDDSVIDQFTRGDVVAAFNAGGPALTQDGIDFAAAANGTDGAPFSGGAPFTDNNGGNGQQPVYDGTIYETEINDGGNDGTPGFTFSSAQGIEAGKSYFVDLYFAEIFTNDPAARVFDVSLEGELVIDDLSVVGTTGDANAPLVVELAQPVSPGDNGAIDLSFVASVDRAKISGIVIREAIPADTDTAEVSVSDVTVDEEAGTASVTFTRTGADDEAVSVTYSTADGTATAGEDYAAVSGATVEIPAGAAGTVTVDIALAGDAVEEADETFTVTIDAATAATNTITGVGASATVTLTDDDAAPAPVGFGPNDDFDQDGTINADDLDDDGDTLPDTEETFRFDETNAGMALVAGEGDTLDFEADGSPFEAGFTGVLDSPKASTQELDLDAATVEGGQLVIDVSNGDHFQDNNTQQNAFVKAYSSAEGLRVATVFDAPDFNAGADGIASVNFQSVGVVFGLDQDALVKLVFGRTGPQIEFTGDGGGSGISGNATNLPGLDYAQVAKVALAMEIYPEGGVAKAVGTATFLDADGAVLGMFDATPEAAAKTIGGAVGAAIVAGEPVGAGVIQTSTPGGNGVASFQVAYDEVTVTGLGIAFVPTVSVVSGATVAEAGDAGSQTAVEFALATDGPDGTVAVTYELGGVSTTTDVDFAAGAGTLTVLVDDDDLADGDDAVAITLTAATDAQIGTATATATVTEDDAAPVAVAPADQEAGEALAFSFALPEGTFTDADTEELTLAATLADGTALPDWLTFDPATGTFSGTPETADVGALSVTVTANDGTNAPAEATFALDVAANLAPTTDPVDGGTVPESAAAQTIDLLALADDTDGDTLTVENIVATDSDGAEVATTLDADGRTLSIDPAQFAAALDAGESTTVSVAYDVVDGRGGVAQGQASLVVDGEADPTVWFRDLDGDTYGDDTDTLNAITQPDGYVARGGDADDNDATVFPGAPEINDGLDNDQDGDVDEDNSAPVITPIDAGTAGEADAPVVIDLLEGATDADSDELSVENVLVTDGTDPVTAVLDGTTLSIDPAQFAAALAEGEQATLAITYEVVDGFGGVTPGTATLVVDGAGGTTTWFRDADLDGFGTDLDTVEAVEQPAGYVAVGGDADDTDATVFPGAPEINDGLDNDQDGDVDEDNTAPTAADLDRQTVSGEALTIPVADLLAGAADIDGDDLSVVSVTATNGTATLDGDVVRFEAGDGFVGAASIAFTVSDGFGGTVEASVSVDVTDPSGGDGETALAFASGGVASWGTGFRATVQDQPPPAAAAPVVDGNSVTLGANNWKSVALEAPITVEAGSELRFDYSATGIFELVFVGFDSDTGATDDTGATYQIGGTDRYSFATAIEPNAYDTTGETVSYVISLDALAGETVDRLVLVQDQDVRNPVINVAEGTFSNLRLVAPGGGANQPPEADDDAVTAQAGAALEIQAATLLANDSDPEGTALTLVSVEGAENGTVSLAGGVVTFTPDAGYAGPASFTYTVRDADGATDTATVSVTVEGGGGGGTVTPIDFGAAPIRSYSGGQDVTPAGFEVGDDGDALTLSGNTWKRIALPDGDYTVTGDTVLRVQLTMLGDAGEIVAIGLEADNNPNNANGKVYQLAGTQSYARAVDLRGVGDGSGFFEIPLDALVGRSVRDLVLIADDDADAGIVARFEGVALVERTATGTGEAPRPASGGALPDLVVAEDGVLEFELAVIDPDTPRGELEVAYTGLPGFVSVDGFDLSGTPLNADVGTTTVGVRVADPDGNAFTGTFDLTVTDTNDPVEAVGTPDDASGVLGVGLNLPLADGLFVDPDVGEVLSYSATGLPAGLSIDSETGAITGAATEAGLFTVTIEASDGEFSDTVQLSLEIRATPPREEVLIEAEDFTAFAGDGDPVLNFQEYFDGDASGNALIRVDGRQFGSVSTDLTAGGVGAGRYDLTVVVFDENDGVSTLDVSIQAADGTLTSVGTVELDRSFEGQGNGGQAENRVEVLIPAVDVPAGARLVISGRAQGAELLRIDAVRFDPLDDAPAAFTSPAAFSAAEGSTLAGTVAASDPEGEAVSYAIEGGADAGAFEIDADTGALTFAEVPDFEAPADQGGDNTYQVRVSASDGVNTTTQSVTVTVTDGPDGPVITGPTALVADENQTAAGTVEAISGGGVLTFSLAGTGADEALFTIDAATGALTFVGAPDFEAPADAGGDNAYDVDVTATEGALSDTASVTVAVQDVNDAPEADTPAPVQVTAGGPVSVDLGTVFSDQDGDDLSFAVVSGAPDGVTLEGGVLSGAPTVPGSYAVVVSASDGEADPVETTIDLTVAPSSAAAVAFAAQSDLVTDETYGVDVTGSAVIEVNGGANGIDASNFGNNSFQVTNTGGKTISAVFIDVTDAVYQDSVFDPNGAGGDNVAKAWQIGSGGTGNTGAFTSASGPDYGVGGTSYFLPGEAPIPATDGSEPGTGTFASNGGFKGAMVKFSAATDGGFNSGEVVTFAGDMDPNSIAGLLKGAVDNGAIDGWDVGGVSGHEMIGGSFTVLFDDGTTATGDLGTDGSASGAHAVASEGAAPEAPTLTVNDVAAGDTGTYGVTTPTVIVTGAPGQTVRVMLTKGFDAVTNPVVDDIVDQRLDRYDFQANNTFDNQFVDVTLDGTGQADVSDAFEYNAAVKNNQGSFDGGGTAPLAFVASVIDGQGRPASALTAPVVLTNDGGPVGSGGGGEEVVFRINAGGAQVASLDDGPAWAGDAVGSENQYLVTTDSRADTQGYSGDAAAIPAGVPEAVLDTARSSNAPFTYDIPTSVLGGGENYEVRLHVAELFPGGQGGDFRIFDATLEGFVPTAFDDVDPGTAFGADVGVLTAQVNVADGALTIGLTQDVKQNPIVNAIEIVALDEEVTNPGEGGGGGGAANAAEAFAAQTDLATTASYGDGASGAAVLEIMAGNGNMQASNFGQNSFEVTNLGDKTISAVFIDVTEAIYPDTVFDPDGKGGDDAAKAWQIGNGGTGNTGAFTSESGPDYGVGGTSYFLPGEAPVPATGDSNGGYKGAMVKFSATTDGGFETGEVVTFAGDMDPNSIAALSKDAVDSGAINGWDVGGISGHEMIGGSFTVLFDDGTTATGEIGSDTSASGALALASQSGGQATPSLTVNGFGDGQDGTYGVDQPTVIVEGNPGQTVRVTLTKGFDPVTNSAVDATVDQRLDRYDFQVNNAFDIQTADVTLDGSGQADLSSEFDWVDAPANNVGGFDGGGTAQVSLVASAIDGDGRPVSGVTSPIVLTNAGGPVTGGTGGGGEEGAYQLVGSGSNARFKVQIEDENANGGQNPGGKWSFQDAADDDANQAGFQGEGYYLYGDSTNLGINGVVNSEVLEYTILVPEGETGTYSFRARVARDGAPEGDLQNDLWLNFQAEGSAQSIEDYLVEGGNEPEPTSQGYIKVFGGPNNGNWGNAANWDGVPGNPATQLQIDEPGLYTVQIAGRSQGYHLDFWELYKGGAPGTGASDSPFDADGDTGGGDGGSPSELVYAVDASSDDWEEFGQAGSSDLEFGANGGNLQSVGIRFDGIDIPDGAVITGAFLRFQAIEDGAGDADFLVEVEDTEDAATYSTASTPDDRDYAAETFAWSDVEPWNDGEVYQTGDLTALVEAAIGGDGVEDGALAFRVTGTGSRAAHAFDSNGDAPELVIQLDPDSLL